MWGFDPGSPGIGLGASMGAAFRLEIFVIHNSNRCKHCKHERNLVFPVFH